MTFLHCSLTAVVISPSLSHCVCLSMCLFQSMAKSWLLSCLPCTVPTQITDQHTSSKACWTGLWESHALWFLAALFWSSAACCRICSEQQGDDGVWSPQWYSGPRGPVWLQLPWSRRTAGLHTGRWTLHSPEEDERWLVAGENFFFHFLCLLRQWTHKCHENKNMYK